MSDSDPHRPAPAASGRLQKTPVLHLLVYALERKLTGTLELTAPSGESAAVLFIEGNPSKARTSEPVAYLGRVMLELGYISEVQLNHSLMEISKSKRLHGQVLLDAGIIRDDQLEEALRQQLVRKLRHTFSLPPETEFAYYDSFDSLHTYGSGDVVSIDPLPLTWAAVREAPPWEHVHAALTRVANVALRLSSKSDVARFAFDARELQVLELLRARPMRMPEIAATEILKPREAQLLIYCLLITKQLQVVQDRASMPPRLEPTPSARPAPFTPPPNPEQQNALSFSLRAAIATRPSIPPPAPSRDKPSGGSQPAAKPAPLENTRPPSLSPAAIAALPPELAARRLEIVERASMIDREDYFQMLDVNRDADVEAVKNAFFALAKTWHPDRLPAPILDVRDACSRVFARLSEAHQTLTDPARRARYMELLKGGGATPEAQEKIAAVIDAATNFQKAEICLRRSDLVQAEALCRKATESDPDQPDYLALLAWLGAMKPENQSPSATLSHIQKLDKAIALSKNCERAYFYRGMLHKRLNNSGPAVRDFRKAAELNPRNIDAAREVRLHEMRSQKGSIPPPQSGRPGAAKSESTKPGGIFGNLFNKKK